DMWVEAVEIDRNSNPTGTYVTGQDYRIGMTYRTTQEFTKKLSELQDTYTYNIQEIMENRMALAIQKLGDRKLMRLVHAGLGYDVTNGTLRSGVNSGSKQILDFRFYYEAGQISRGIQSEMIVQTIQRFGSKVSDAAKATNNIE